MNLSYRFRIYPTKVQKDFFERQFGSCRWVYNYFLDRQLKYFEETGKYHDFHSNCGELTKLKRLPQYVWLKDGNAQSLQQELKGLDRGFIKYFRHNGDVPHFHRKYDKNTFKVPQTITIRDNRLFIPKIRDGIPIICHREVSGKIIFCTIEKTATCKYFAIITCKDAIVKQLPMSSNEVGIDVGVSTLITCSYGEKFANRMDYEKNKKHLKFLRRQLIKKKNGGTRRSKARLRYSRCHEKIRNRRQNYLHHITTTLVRENQTICAEGLHIQHLMSSRVIAQKLMSASMGTLLYQLEYKCRFYGRDFVRIPRFYPSSKRCNNCGYILPHLSVDTREWFCPNCGMKNDRDLNAAKNILDKGKQMISSTGCGAQSVGKEKSGEALDQSKSVNQEAIRAVHGI